MDESSWRYILYLIVRFDEEALAGLDVDHTNCEEASLILVDFFDLGLEGFNE